MGNIKKDLEHYFNEDTKLTGVDLRLLAGILKKRVSLKPSNSKNPDSKSLFNNSKSLISMNESSRSDQATLVNAE